jgi:predicted ABC-type ATPase
MDNNKILFVIAGPNGSGKSTLTKFWETLDDFPGHYINTDEIKILEGLTDAEAMARAEEMRNHALSNNLSLAFETVMSHPSKIEFMQLAKTQGYRIKLCFIFTQSPTINVKRVFGRHKNGGHDVPQDKIISRYHRSLKLLRFAFKISDIAFIYDNSFDRPLEIANKTFDPIQTISMTHIYPNNNWTETNIRNLLG